MIDVIRHAPANYPNDELSRVGMLLAVANSHLFSSREIVVCSSKNRSQQTAQYLGYRSWIVDHRLDEYEAGDINAATAEGYVQALHDQRWDQLIEFGYSLLRAIDDYKSHDRVLLISHNAIMSAVCRIKTGEVKTFENLRGFKIE